MAGAQNVGLYTRNGLLLTSTWHENVKTVESWTAFLNHSFGASQQSYAYQEWA
jgi:hypothetical protein